ncbi:alpha/beta hydrolase [Streptomyces sp. NBC_00038]|uniref:alpha/beta hydrolase n=1 Tax=Streptomyces sp. NBC_00038 TaxID=2903615 RepID=UPI00225A061E|nr:alpha/beta hydrolase [Streptomyces sp. NBC_00038]MCX5561385.1 alpha/beta hydrolase [Streptomyces sp. NBC_00038]
MPLDPRLVPLLEQFNAQPQPTRTTAEERRNALAHTPVAEQFAALIAPPPAVARVWEEHLSVARPADEITVRVYRPEQAEQNTAGALLHMHGGGWWSGTLEDVDDRCRHLADGAGIVVVSLAYRLAPEHPWPTAVHDALGALRWMVAHAARLGIDPARIGVGGESAGANIAAALALLTRDLNGPGLRMQLLEIPALDLTLSSPSRQTHGAEYARNRDELTWCVEQYAADHDVKDPLVSPLLAHDLTGLPPAVITAAEYDPLADDALRYAERLRQAQVPCTHTEYPGLLHGAHHMTALLPVAQRWQDDVVAAVGHHLDLRTR